MSAPPGLSLVMPAYNEEGAIAGVVEEWVAELERLGLDYEVRVYDDGSRDRTPELLDELARRHPRLTLVRQANRGHGPTLLRAYGEATGEWVFQVDSDGEMSPAGFAPLWQRRENYDLLVGSRQGREAPPLRRLVTAVSRLTVRLCFGRGVRDVNSPYRLMRGSRLRELLPLLPPEPFAPNVILSGLAARERLRIGEWPVACQPRRSGPGSLTPLKVLRGATRSLLQTLTAALRAPRPGA